MKNMRSQYEPPDFSLVLGGPFFQLLMRLRLTDSALGLLIKRIVCITLFAWLPLLLLSLIDGKAWKGVELPFLYDIETQARFLAALPLLIAAELTVHQRIRLIVEQFIERNMITNKVLPKFSKLVSSAMKLRNSLMIEAFLLVLVFVLGHYLWSLVSIMETVSSEAGTWIAVHAGSGSYLSMAGYWYIFVSRPLFQFILLRWYFRLLIWTRFLWQSSRLELNLFPSHPDRACGLGFLSTSIGAFAPLILAHGVLLSGLMANSIFFSGTKLTDFALLINGILVLLLLIFLGPLLAFSSSIMRAKINGLYEYGVLAYKYVSEFDLKWIHGGAADKEKLIGSSDIQSLADMGNSFQVINEIRPFPFGKDAVIQIIVIALIPVIPLVLTMVPLRELINKLFETIF